MLTEALFDSLSAVSIAAVSRDLEKSPNKQCANGMTTESCKSLSARALASGSLLIQFLNHCLLGFLVFREHGNISYLNVSL